MTAYSDITQEKNIDYNDGLSTSDGLTTTSLLQEVFVTLLTVLLLSGLFTNSVFFFLFYRQAKLRSFSNRFVLCLCASHLLQCILVIPFILASVINQKWVLGDIWCQVTGVSSVSLMLATVLSLMMIAIDRNYAVNSPLHYSQTVTKSRTSLLIVFIWTVSLASSLPQVCGVGMIKYNSKWHVCGVAWTSGDKYTAAYSLYLLVLGFVIPFFTMTCIYVAMYRAAKHNSARARRHSVNSAGKHSALSSSKKSFARRRSSSGSQSSLFGEEWKAAKTGVFIVFSFAVCWLPLFTVIQLETFTEFGKALPEWLVITSTLLSFSAIVINPYLYVYRSKSTRSQLRNVIRWCSNGRRNRCSIYAQNRKLFVPPIASSSFKLPGDRITSWPRIAIYDGRTEHQVSCISSPVNNNNSKICLEQGVLSNHLLNAMDLDLSTLKPSERMMIFKLGSKTRKGSSTSDSTDDGECKIHVEEAVSSSKRVLTRTRSMGVVGSLGGPHEFISQIGIQRRRSFVMTRYRVEGSDETNSTSLESQEANEAPLPNVTSDLSGRERRLLYRQWNRSGSEDAGYISRRSSTCSIVSSDSDTLVNGKCLDL